MPGNCSTTTTSLYEAAHNPAVYYTDAAAQCPTWDLPAGSTSSGSLLTDLENNTLPGFSFVIPNECNNGGCSVTTGDTWLSSWVPLITASPAYQQGTTAVFITWDEGGGGTKGEDCTTNTSDPSCHVPMLVLSPYTTPATTSNTFYTHYSLLRTTEDLLNLPHLAHAADPTTNSLTPAFISTGGGSQFPSTPVLDTFNRPNEGPPPTGWGPRAESTGGQLKVVSNQAMATAANGSDVWSAAFLADEEAYATYVSGVGSVTLVGRVHSPNTSPVMYQVEFIPSASLVRFWKETASGVYVQIGSTLSASISPGANVGMSIVGTTLTAYTTRTAGGAWSPIGSVIDSAISGPGYIGLELSTTSVIVDNFGGGTH